MGSASNVGQAGSRWRRGLRVTLLLLGDFCILQVSLLGSLFIRFDGAIPASYWTSYIRIWPWYTGASLAIFIWAGFYRNLWRYAGIEELVAVCGTTTISTSIVALLSVFYPLPRSVIVMHWLTTSFLEASFRVVLRAVRKVWSRRERLAEATSQTSGEHIRVLIIGAGRVGANLVLPLQESGREIVGFLDDDPAKKDMQIHGIRVLGTLADTARVVAEHEVQEVLLALPTRAHRKQREIVDALGEMNVTLRTIPAMNELIDGKVSISQIRPVSIADLLGREAVTLNSQQIAAEISDEVVLVTGAGGSIGSELCRQICRFSPKLLVMLGHGENSIFEASLHLDELFAEVEKVGVIADVRDRVKMEEVFTTYKPAYVFHAAAHKHVPFMESYPDEAVKTNVFGTQNVARAALHSGARKFVMISTDKAVNPSSVMGATKRVAEMLVQNLNGKGKTKFVSVRFGNVLGSRGSVIPVFQRQIARGGPVTVTHPDMRRYFMTIPEAAQLVLQAAALGRGGEVFVLDMGEPVKIVDLARNLITLSGFRPNKDIQIVFTGCRPGEKLFEELLMDEEATSVTEHSRIFTCQNARVPSDELSRGLAMLERMVFSGQSTQIPVALGKLVANYTPYMPEARAEDEEAVVSSQ